MELIQDGAKDIDDVQIFLLVQSADIVGLAEPALFEDSQDRVAVIRDIEPVAHVLTVPINWKGFRADCIVNHQGNQFLRKLIWAVVIGAVRGKHRQAIGVEVGANQVVGRGLRRGVGAIGPVWRLFVEGRLVRTERTVDFVRRDVQEAERTPAGAGQWAPMLQSGLEKGECPGDVGLHKRRGAQDGAVHMTFRGKMNDCVGLVPGQQARYQRAVEDGAVDEYVGWIAVERAQVVDITRVGERVEIDDFVAAAHRFEDKVGTDKTRAAGHQ